MKRAVFPGSFDPLTLGHQDIVERGATIFDEIIVGIGYNAEKSHMFSIEQRKEFIAQCFQDNPKVKVMDYQGLTIDFCKSVGANYLLRGVRNNGDFDFEKAIHNRISAEKISVFFEVMNHIPAIVNEFREKK